MIYEVKRGDVLHRYEANDSGISYSAGTMTRFALAWKDVRSLEPFRGGAISFKANDRRRLTVWLENDAMKPFLADAMARWRKVDEAVSVRAASNYCYAKPFARCLWLAFIVALPGALTAYWLKGDLHSVAGWISAGATAFTAYLALRRLKRLHPHRDSIRAFLVASSQK